MINSIKNLFFSGDPKFRQIKIYTFFNFIFKILSVACTFLMVPAILSYINKSEYGVWLTLTSITTWLSYIDIGLGNGMRNKLSEAIATDNKKLAKQYVSTTYLIFSILILALLLLFALCNIFLNWNVILKTSIPGKNLLLITYIIVFSFSMRLLFGLAITAVVALQKVYFDSLINFLINFFTLIGVYILPKWHTPSFTLFSILTAITPVVILLIFNIYLFGLSPFKYLRPDIKNFKQEYIKSLLNVGVQFFFIQFIGIIIFSTDNILITQFFSAADVTSFNIAYKYFSISTLSFTIILSPYWSAFTISYLQKDFFWIKSAIRKLILLWLLQFFGVIILIAISNFVYHFWVGSYVSMRLSLALGIYSVIYNWNNIFGYFINGVSKIRLQVYSSIFAGLLNIPLSYMLVKHTHMGVSAIVIANTICLFISSVWAPVQCYKLLNNTASGIWNR